MAVVDGEKGIWIYRIIYLLSFCAKFSSAFFIFKYFPWLPPTTNVKRVHKLQTILIKQSGLVLRLLLAGKSFKSSPLPPSTIARGLIIILHSRTKWGKRTFKFPNEIRFLSPIKGKVGNVHHGKESLSDFSLPLLSLAFHGSQLRSSSLISLLRFLAFILTGTRNLALFSIAHRLQQGIRFGWGTRRGMGWTTRNREREWRC